MILFTVEVTTYPTFLQYVIASFRCFFLCHLHVLIIRFLFYFFQYVENENDNPIPLEKAVQLRNLQGLVVYIEYQVTLIFLISSVYSRKCKLIWTDVKY